MSVASKDHAQVLRKCFSVQIPEGSRWRHHKGGVYTIVAVSCPEDNPLEILITYRSVEYGSVWTRTVKNWRSCATNEEGTPRARFERVRFEGEDDA
jgi:hypothetical protein